MRFTPARRAMAALTAALAVGAALAAPAQAATPHHHLSHARRNPRVRGRRRQGDRRGAPRPHWPPRVPAALRLRSRHAWPIASSSIAA